MKATGAVHLKHIKENSYIYVADDPPDDGGGGWYYQQAAGKYSVDLNALGVADKDGKLGKIGEEVTDGSGKKSEPATTFDLADIVKLNDEELQDVKKLLPKDGQLKEDSYFDMDGTYYVQAASNGESRGTTWRKVGIQPLAGSPIAANEKLKSIIAAASEAAAKAKNALGSKWRRLGDSTPSLVESDKDTYLIAETLATTSAEKGKDLAAMLKKKVEEQQHSLVDVAVEFIDLTPKEMEDAGMEAIETAMTANGHKKGFINSYIKVDLSKVKGGAVGMEYFEQAAGDKCKLGWLSGWTELDCWAEAFQKTQATVGRLVKDAAETFNFFDALGGEKYKTCMAAAKATAVAEAKVEKAKKEMLEAKEEAQKAVKEEALKKAQANLEHGADKTYENGDLITADDEQPTSLLSKLMEKAETAVENAADKIKHMNVKEFIMDRTVKPMVASTTKGLGTVLEGMLTASNGFKAFIGSDGNLNQTVVDNLPKEMAEGLRGLLSFNPTMECVMQSNIMGTISLWIVKPIAWVTGLVMRAAFALWHGLLGFRDFIHGPPEGALALPEMHPTVPGLGYDAPVLGEKWERFLGDGVPEGERFSNKALETGLREAVKAKKEVAGIESQQEEENEDKRVTEKIDEATQAVNEAEKALEDAKKKEQKQKVKEEAAIEAAKKAEASGDEAAKEEAEKAVAAEKGSLFSLSARAKAEKAVADATKELDKKKSEEDLARSEIQTKFSRDKVKTFKFVGLREDSFVEVCGTTRRGVCKYYTQAVALPKPSQPDQMDEARATRARLAELKRLKEAGRLHGEGDKELAEAQARLATLEQKIVEGGGIPPGGSIVKLNATHAEVLDASGKPVLKDGKPLKVQLDTDGKPKPAPKSAQQPAQQPAQPPAGQGGDSRRHVVSGRGHELAAMSQGATPHTFFTMVVNFVGKIAAQLDPRNLLEDLELKDTIDKALDDFCKAKMDEFTGFIATRSVPASVCSLGDGVSLEKGIGQVMDTTINYLFEEAMLALHKYFWTPLTSELTKLLGQGMAALTELLDGLCGLIPYAGGPVCMMITTPLGATMSALLTELASSTIDSFVVSVEEHVKATYVPHIADYAALRLVEQLKEGTLPKAPNFDEFFREQHRRHEQGEHKLDALEHSVQSLREQSEHWIANNGLAAELPHPGWYTPPVHRAQVHAHASRAARAEAKAERAVRADNAAFDHNASAADDHPSHWVKHLGWDGLPYASGPHAPGPQQPRGLLERTSDPILKRRAAASRGHGVEGSEEGSEHEHEVRAAMGEGTAKMSMYTMVKPIIMLTEPIVTFELQLIYGYITDSISKCSDDYDAIRVLVQDLGICTRPQQHLPNLKQQARDAIILAGKRPNKTFKKWFSYLWPTKTEGEESTWKWPWDWSTKPEEIIEEIKDPQVRSKK
jgi:hypothetical protein